MKNCMGKNRNLTIKALTILRDNTNITAGRFAQLYFDQPEQEYLFTAVSNQGNGACAGKKAWLCAGSLLGRLAKKDFVLKKTYMNPTRYSLTEKGRKELLKVTEQ